MRHYFRFLQQTALYAASVGVITGGVFAVRETAPQQYLAQHLWHTVLWILCRYTLVGALLGAAGAVFVVLALVTWKVEITTGPSTSQGSERGYVMQLATLFSVCAAVAVLLVPTEAPEVLGVSHWLAVAACIALVWVIVSGYIADTPEGTPGSSSYPSGFNLLWYQFVGLACLVAVSHMWARALPGWLTGFSTGLGLVGATVTFRLLYRPVRRLAVWLQAAAVWAGGAGARRLPAVVMAMVTALWLTGWILGMQARSDASESRMNIIVIAVDTLRWDAVSLLSSDEHDRDLTPNLREHLASRGTVFSRAYSQAPWTLPAFASIFTGLYPEQHKAEHVWSRLEPHQVTLAEVLREHGYRTMAVLSGHYVSSDVGMTQGFATYDESLAAGAQIISSDGVTDLALQFLEGRGEDPFFLFVHYFDPHFPYLTHSEIDLGPQREDERVDIPANGEGRWWVKPAGKAMASLNGDLIPYKEEVAYTDLHIGRLLAFIEERKLWENTCVVFVADHGEEFFEHGGSGHDNTVFEEVVRVPLCIAAPSLDLPRVISQPVETRWLFGSLLELLGIPSPETTGSAPSLFAAEDIGGDGYARSSACPRGRTGVRGSAKPTVWLSCLTGTRQKLIEDHLRGRTMYFDLLQDPGELADLSEQQPEIAARLRRTLAERDAEVLDMRETDSPPTMSDEELERLKSLGYL